MNQEFFYRGVAELIEQKSFKDKLTSGRKLKIKFGVDPTRPDIHLGHSVVMWRLKELQDAGHTIIFLIGDYTTKIGDPSGRNTTRPVLTDKEIAENAKTYFNQVGKILNIDKTEIRYNSEWYSKMNFNDILQIAGKFTVAQIIERDDFEKRLKAGTDIGLHEMLYPLMQAYDSIVLNADVEVGGSDQRFNMLAGRDLQKKMGQSPQDVVIFDLLVGLDGKVKMSKSVGNYIALTDTPSTMFGKIMSIPDTLIVDYFILCTKLPDAEIGKIKENLSAGENPRDIKIRLGFEIVKLYYGEVEAENAKEEFINVFSKKELPKEMTECKISAKQLTLLKLLTELDAAESSSGARRVIEQGGVKIDGERVTDPNSEIEIVPGKVIQVGKRKYFKLI